MRSGDRRCWISNFVHQLAQQYPDYQIIVVDALTYAGSSDNLPARCASLKTSACVSGMATSVVQASSKRSCARRIMSCISLRKRMLRKTCAGLFRRGPRLYIPDGSVVSTMIRIPRWRRTQVEFPAERGLLWRQWCGGARPKAGCKSCPASVSLKTGPRRPPACSAAIDRELDAAGFSLQRRFRVVRDSCFSRCSARCF